MRRMSICFIKFPISGLGELNIYHDSGVFYKNVGSSGGKFTGKKEKGCQQTSLQILY